MFANNSKTIFDINVNINHKIGAIPMFVCKSVILTFTKILKKIYGPKLCSFGIIPVNYTNVIENS